MSTEPTKHDQSVPTPRASAYDAELEREIEAALGGMSVEDLEGASTPSRGGQRGGGRQSRQGTIIRVHAGDVFVEFGPRSQGVCPLAQFLANQPGSVAGKASLDTVQATTKLYWPIFWEQVDLIQPILQPQQRALVPFVDNISRVTAEQRKNSQWQFGYPVPLKHNRPRVGGEGGNQSVSISRNGV